MAISKSYVWRVAVIVAISLGIAAPAARAAGPPGGLNVLVTNPASSPVPVTLTNGPVSVQSTEVPFSVDVVGTCNDTNCFIDFPEVPSGKMLIIKYISALARPSSGSPAIFDFAELVASNTEDETIGTRFIFPLARIGQAGSSVIADTYGGSTPVLAFVRQGQQARLTLATHVSGAILFSQGTISGALVNAPQ